MAQLIIGSKRAEDFAREAKARAPERDIRLWPDVGDVKDIRHALAWGPHPGELAKLPNLELIVSVGAGVDHLFRDPELPTAPTIVRYVDPDLTGRMKEYVVLHNLMHLRRMVEYRDQQAGALWRYLPEPAAHEVRCGIMGLGVLGAAAAQALMAVGFQVNGWSRSPKSVPGVRSFHGEEQLDGFLAETDILTVLLPLTPQTRNIIDRDLLAKLSSKDRPPRLPAPSVINAGRGGLQVEGDIVAALDSGQLYAASLDVFQQEPLPKSSDLWGHRRVVITPHNAAESTTPSIIRYFLNAVDCAEAGQPLENIVDRAHQY